MSEEHKVYVPLRGRYIEQTTPIYSTRWYEEQGVELPPDKPSALRALRCWLYRIGVRFDRKERWLRLWRLYISWDCE